MSDKTTMKKENPNDGKINVEEGMKKNTSDISDVDVDVDENVIASDSRYDDSGPEQPDTDDRQGVLLEAIKKKTGKNVNLIKFFMLVLILIVLLIIVINFFTSPSSDSNNNPLNSVIPSNLSDHVTPVKKEGGKNDPINLIGEVPLIDPLAITTLQEDISRVRHENALLRKRIDDLALSSDQRVIRIDRLKVGLDEIITTRIPTLASANDVFERKLKSVSKSVQQNKERIINALKDRRETPPFLLLSVDEWGSSVSAVVNMAGRVTTVSVGDVHAGWVISRIERSCIYVSQIDVKDVKICVSGAQ